MTALVLSLLLSASDPGVDKPAVAVTAFEVHSGDKELQFLGKGFADMILGDLVAWDGMVVVDRDRLQAAIDELKLQRTKYFDPKTRLKIGKFVGARYIVGGSLLPNKDQLHIEATMVDAMTGETKATAKVTGHRDDVFDLEQQLVDKLTASIDAHVRDPGGRRRVRVPTLAALADYGKALDLSDQGNVEEASKAFTALVSKVPTFGLARERKAEVLKQLEELAKRRKDLITASVLWVSKRADDVLAHDGKFAKLGDEGQIELMAMRQLKGRVIIRRLKQHLSNHDESLRLVLEGHEAQAMALMRAWVANERQLLDEMDSYARQHRQVWQGRKLPVSYSYSTPNELKRKLDESGLGSVSLNDLEFEELAKFILMGRADDGQNFHLAPALGDLDPKEQQAVLAELDRRVAEAIKDEQANYGDGERYFDPYLELKASWFKRQDRIDDAVGAYQQLLDAAPKGRRANSAEKEIKDIIEGKGYWLGRRQEWDHALKTCDDMSIRGGSLGTSGWVYREGIKGYDTIANMLLKACGGKNRDSAVAQALRDVAMGAARGGSCERALKYFRLNIELGGSFSEMKGYNKNYIPWCDLSSITPQNTPTRVRVSMAGGDMSIEERAMAGVAAEFITRELAARGYVIGPESSYRGGDRRIWVGAELGQKESWLSLKLLKDSDDEGAEFAIQEKGGAFDLDKLLAPILAHMRVGTKLVDDKPHASLPMPLLRGVVEVIDLTRDRKKDDALKRLDALEKKYPGFPTLGELREEVEKRK